MDNLGTLIILSLLEAINTLLTIMECCRKRNLYLFRKLVIAVFLIKTRSYLRVLSELGLGGPWTINKCLDLQSKYCKGVM